MKSVKIGIRTIFLFFVFLIAVNIASAANLGYWGGEAFIAGTKVTTGYTISVYGDGTKIREDTLGTGPEVPADFYLLVVEESEGQGKSITFKIKEQGAADTCTRESNLVAQNWSIGAHNLNLTFASQPSCPAGGGGGGGGSTAAETQIITLSTSGVIYTGLSVGDQFQFTLDGVLATLEILEISSDGTQAEFSLESTGSDTQYFTLKEGQSTTLDIDSSINEKLYLQLTDITGDELSLLIKELLIKPLETIVLPEAEEESKEGAEPTTPTTQPTSSEGQPQAEEQVPESKPNIVVGLMVVGIILISGTVVAFIIIGKNH